MKTMLRTDTDWTPFNQEWGMQYKNAKHILSYLNTYPVVLNTLKFGEIHNPVNLDDAQNEWIWLCSKFDNPLETEFFKPYWIPIEVNSYDYFMDISDEKYPIFEIHYFFYEPFRWYKKFITTDIKDLLLAPDTGLDLRKLRDKNDKIRWAQVDEYFKERRRLGYEGKIYVKPVEKDELSIEDLDSSCINVVTKKSTVEIFGVTSLIAGLLSYDLRINLVYLNYKNGIPNESVHKIKIIRDLIFLLRESGLRRVGSYRIDFPDSKNCYLEYKNESCILHHIDISILKGFEKVVSELK